MNLQEKLLHYFYRYTEIPSQSDSSQTKVPSSEGQFELARLLTKDLAELGFIDINLSDKAVVTAHLPSNLPASHKKVPKIGWCCHLDTVDVGLSPVIKPQLIKNYKGGDICQNPEQKIFLKAADNPEILQYIGDDILVSDGTSVLGADNKAAIANVMTAFSELKEKPEILHGDIYIAFVPDEEIGLRGSKALDLKLFPVDFAYTIDCCALGELVFETFNAASATLKIKGATAHPMCSKNRVVNPVLIATDFIMLLDRAKTPEHTEKTEGFIWVTDVEAHELYGTVSMLLRDHSKKIFAADKEYLRKAADLVALKYPKAEIELKITDVYANIKDAVTSENQLGIDYLYEAMRKLNIEPQVIAMRGGTDGSYLAACGIMTPNYFTGAHNFHAVTEFLPLKSFEASCRLTLKLIELSVS